MSKKVMVLVLAVMILGATGFAFADGPFGPASIYGEVSGKTEAEAYAEKTEAGATFGELAKEKGLYDEFKAKALEAKKEKIEELVAAGKLTREDADTILENLENCDGVPSGVMKNGLGLGQKAGNGQGNGLRDGSGQQGNGQGAGQGQGRMLQNRTV